MSGSDTARALKALVKALRADGIFVLEHAPFGARTTYRVGGVAAAGVELASVEQLEHLGSALVELEHAPPCFVLGRGSNVLVADAGFPGLLITLGAGFSWLREEDAVVELGGGSPLPVMARRTASLGLAGFTWAVGVPGSVGGAVRMNAGGHGHGMEERLEAAMLIDLVAGAPPSWRRAEELELGYRTSSVSATQVVVAARLRLEPADPKVLGAEIDEIVAWRRAHQPGGQNAGSVFVNPVDVPAALLIEQCGLKGFRFGSASVSSKHANFIQAQPGGSADDVYHLMQAVRDRVREQTGVELRTEVRLVGFDTMEV
ncbi:MAG: UDP-N-acetylmuramate dehydrogenase [Ferrimicrobium sp.]|jgi:UDP-N-acetylmuramate dehydrogenase|uniref:UDP-N-acetylenolpyruvoylglucosamine reductase n=1 Tax=Ferrimicrobium acidiphilum TaxID=121039 RepID=A0ABV3Y170_9ACTN|nr:UDP-N-acetylmuramate dehydrogenase [Ferrimicrobium sp.]